MIRETGEITEVIRSGAEITIRRPITAGQSTKLHPGPVHLIQDGNPNIQINESLYDMLSAMAIGMEHGMNNADARDWLKRAKPILEKAKEAMASDGNTK